MSFLHFQQIILSSLASQILDDYLVILQRLQLYGAVFMSQLLQSASL